MKSKNNGKKEFPIDGNEEDLCYARRIYRYLSNPKNVKFLKTKMNKRFRKFNKNLAKDGTETEPS
jgi:hypothetical protein